ncbi:MAG: hypothetical protein IJ514_07395 [Clostridia bacterium]|nr:hypothetical protein [Clostridia bacterium]
MRGKKSVLKNCEIYTMLKAHARKKHLSFHTPGHKDGRWDITELAYSDNLASPHGCIARAEKDIARALGAAKSYILTDGSTSGVHAMLYAAKRLGVTTLALSPLSHKSVFHGAAALSIRLVTFESEAELEQALSLADALFITSPDYYGNIPDLENIRALCEKRSKMLLIDGAHGGHLHFNKRLYAGAYAHLWVDGVHKSLPALTQGAVVSASTGALAEALLEGVDIFRTSSPSYPVMASVEYAVKYPENERLEVAVRAFARESGERVEVNEDWTKLCCVFGDAAYAAEKELEKNGVYAEFCDGARLVFYLSPATKRKHFNALKKALRRLFKRYPVSGNFENKRAPAPLLLPENAEKEWVDMQEATGKICAAACGLFPPCTPLIRVGERVTEEKIRALQKAINVFGVKDGKISVFIGETKE